MENIPCLCSREEENDPAEPKLLLAGSLPNRTQSTRLKSPDDNTRSC